MLLQAALVKVSNYSKRKVAKTEVGAREWHIAMIDRPDHAGIFLRNVKDFGTLD